jgi:hypothetical protein
MASLTKEELKNALISHGAPVPPASAKKDEFIQAYEEHVAPLDAGGEFSSDEEGPKTPSKRSSNVSKGKQSTSSRKSQGSPKKTPSKVLEESVDIEMNVDIGSLDDDQLFEMLKKNGVEVGPIVASTRKFYEKKLTAALAGETAPASNGTNGTKEFSDTEPEDEEERRRRSSQQWLKWQPKEELQGLPSRAPALSWNQDSASVSPWLTSSTPHLPVLAPGGQSTATRSPRPPGR